MKRDTEFTAPLLFFMDFWMKIARKSEKFPVRFVVKSVVNFWSKILKLAKKVGKIEKFLKNWGGDF